MPALPHAKSLLCLSFLLALCLLTSGAFADDWDTVKIVDVNAFPDDPEPRFHSQSKSIFRGPGGASLIWARFSPRFDDMGPIDPLGPHYHLFHEWAYVLDGDFVIHEPISENQKHGMISQFVQGTWLDRPAYTLHGGVWEIGGMRPQLPCTLIIFEEGDGHVITLGPNGTQFKPDFPDSKPEPWDPDWTKVERFNHPWIVHSAQDLEWERDEEQSGRWVKWLSDDKAGGFRARLVKAPAGWKSPQSTSAQYSEQGSYFIYMLYGDMNIQTFDSKGKPSAMKSVGKDWFIHQPPRAPMSHGEGALTEGGAMWLEVTYAKGITFGGGPIEAPKTLK